MKTDCQESYAHECRLCKKVSLDSGGDGRCFSERIATGVIGGMLFGTFIAILFTPLFYSMIGRAGPEEFLEKPQTNE